MKIFISVITTLLLNPNSMSVSGVETIPDSINPVCFQFTWPGPRYDNTSQINIDCKKHNEPCFKPIVATRELHFKKTSSHRKNFFNFHLHFFNYSISSNDFESKTSAN
ncbi:hypothetical protein KQX54_018803 [Cotesia glomerata]|uniref:Uncharacterized protein n=1 Tax=Cotesia glomerata TaxID=32391 RepID=A0AAV7IT09_COTGL|nr:hypothetical protein KQX54_018803 [Cotesia glomerata]